LLWVKQWVARSQWFRKPNFAITSPNKQRNKQNRQGSEAKEQSKEQARNPKTKIGYIKYTNFIYNNIQNFADSFTHFEPNIFPSDKPFK